ncbi:hypothetical protein [Labrenzia sp. PHM005]|uniref:hypothetical protein n=1 Tax=Labrenzia sp. PHM005 TaxID=2590016 RepID=UPI0011407493|nr:hypothetical protein [Labrenzia sp. PHM005]QDG77534.1 hypothetical protein FJ695_17590 [Labrenzia sp. PHM005]
MSHPRRSRTPMDFDRQKLLQSLGSARAALIEAHRGMKPKSGLARSADAVVSEIDEFALVLTGSRDFFHLKAHGTPQARDDTV